MKGTRGMFGNQVVFKIRKGKQFVSAPPNFNENRKPTPNQRAAQERFKRASEYATEAIQDESTKKAYQKVAGKRQTAQNMAFRDAYNPPEIFSIISQGYTGVPGNIIVVHAVDDFKVTRVNVSIYSSNNVLIETGEASTNKHGMLWVYSTSVANENVAGCVIKVSAYDVPENESKMEVVA
jgi:hypothetical protein